MPRKRPLAVTPLPAARPATCVPCPNGSEPGPSPSPVKLTLLTTLLRSGTFAIPLSIIAMPTPVPLAPYACMAAAAPDVTRRCEADTALLSMGASSEMLCTPGCFDSASSDSTVISTTRPESTLNLRSSFPPSLAASAAAAAFSDGRTLRITRTFSLPLLSLFPPPLSPSLAFSSLCPFTLPSRNRSSLPSCAYRLPARNIATTNPVRSRFISASLLRRRGLVPPAGCPRFNSLIGAQKGFFSQKATNTKTQRHDGALGLKFQTPGADRGENP